MCFILDEKSKPLIAEEDIICYKLVGLVKEKDCVTPFYFPSTGFYYVRDVITPVIRLCPHSERHYSGLIIEEGYHSHTEARYSEQLHSHSIFSYGKNLAIAKFIIPKGSEYYKSDIEYVSDRIIFKEIIETLYKGD